MSPPSPLPIKTTFSHRPKTLLVTDFEATCLKDNTFYDQEIIEFPVHILKKQQILESDAKAAAGSLKYESTINKEESFHSYVRPTINPKLSDFCIDLTKISQSQVDKAPAIEKVLEKLHRWLHEREYVRHDSMQKYCNGDPHTKDVAWWPRKELKFPFIFVTDGPWDFREFMFNECQKKGIAIPCYFRYWINLRFAFTDFYNARVKGIKGMLNYLGMKFEGQLHSGFDDSYNIARIMERMIRDGYEPRVNDGLYKKVKQFAHVQRKIAACKPNGHRVRYVGLLWIDTVSSTLSDLHKKRLIQAGLYKKLIHERDPVTRIQVVYVNTKSHKVAAEFSINCAFRYHLPLVEDSPEQEADETSQNTPSSPKSPDSLNKQKLFYKCCGEDPNSITLDMAVEKLELWAKNQGLFGEKRSYGSFTEKPHKACNCLIAFPHDYNKLMTQLESITPEEPYLYRVASYPEFLSNNLHVYPLENVRDVNKMTRTIPRNKKTDQQRVLDAMEELLKHGALVPKSWLGSGKQKKNKTEAKDSTTQ